MDKLNAAMDQADLADRYEAVRDRRDAALSRMDWCSACREWVSRKDLVTHAETAAHQKAESFYLAQRA